MNVTAKYPIKQWARNCILLLALWVPTYGYYLPHFERALALVLTGVFLGIVCGMYWLGLVLFRPRSFFPYGYFFLAVLGFSLLRWLYTFYILQHYLPADTVFAHPYRVLWFLVPTSAALLFIGYGVAQYRHLRIRNQRQEETVIPVFSTSSAPAVARLLSFRAGGKEVRLPIEDLLHVQGNGEYLLYRCADRQYQRFQRLKEAEKELHPFGFVRIHRSHLVARSAIRSFSLTEAVLADGTVLPVSRTYRGVLN